MLDLRYDTINILPISDTHLGHPSISPEMMCNRYRRLIFPLLPKINLLIWNGDMFDSAISLAENYTNDILAFIAELIDKCIEYNVTILLVRGTFSHDRDQVKIFYTLAQNKKMGDKCLYFDTIAVTEVLGRKFVILPDDLPFKNSNEILDVVHELLKGKNWDRVDYALLHGYFEHVVPLGVHQPKICFSYNQFSFVDRLIDVGHVHTTSIYTPKGKVVPILYNGSPERLRHGEEEAKGCYLITDKRNSPLKIQFLENKETTKFKEYVNNISSDKAISFWTKKFDKYMSEPVAYLKFTHPDIGIRLAVEQLSKKYPNIVFTHRSPKDDNKKILSTSSLSLNTTKTYVPTRETFSKDILQFLKSNNRGEDMTEESIDKLLKDL